MFSFSDIWNATETWASEKIVALEGLFAPIAKQALQAGAADLTTDAASIAQQVLDDPALLTNSAKREMAVAALVKKAEDQGLQLGEHTVAAIATAALANAAAARPGTTAS